MTILVTGARGSVGAAVLEGLIEAGRSVRASSRDPRPGDFPAGVEVVRGDLSRPATFDGLLRGVREVFLYANGDAADEFAAAARDAGVERVVLLSSHSVLFPNAHRNPVAMLHARAERALVDAGVGWTFVRPGYYATNTLRWTSIRTERVVRTAFPEGRTSPVHERDVAGVAVRALLDGSLAGQAFLVPGPGPSTLREQVADISAAIGEPVAVERVGVDAYRAELRAQLADVFIDRLLAAEGTVAQVPEDVRVDAVPLLLGRPSLPFAQWARDHAGDFR